MLLNGVVVVPKAFYKDQGCNLRSSYEGYLL